MPTNFFMVLDEIGNKIPISININTRRQPLNIKLMIKIGTLKQLTKGKG